MRRSPDEGEADERNGYGAVSMRIPPINLTVAEAKALTRAPAFNGYDPPPGSEGWIAYESARAKVYAALKKAEHQKEPAPK